MNDPYREPVLADVSHAGGISHIPKEITDLADRIARQQNCKVTLSKENNGYHLYLPCPACLVSHGRKELQDPKYAINLSKYFGIGDKHRHLQEIEEQDGFNPVRQTHNQSVRDEKNHNTGICMRTYQSANPHRFPVAELLAMAPISVRHPDIHTSYRVINGADSEERESHWEVDPISGAKCPPAAGDITPILELDPSHPARWYLETYRKFDLQRLTDMFRCGFCTKEYTEGRHRIWYRKFPGGWKDTPQHRIIFHSLHKGVPLTWQGRYPEYVTPDGLNKYALHPYAVPLEWSHIATRATAVQAWMPMPPFDEVDDDGHIKFDPAKYKTAKHSGRELMGWDAAIARADADDNPIRWCVLTEGPLDAGRIGPGGIALMGKSISHENAAKVASNFTLVITAFDNDQSGKEATEKISASLSNSHARAKIMQHVEPLVIPTGKDLGELEQSAADSNLLNALKRAMRSL
jgi:hypothetical protein